MTAIRWMAVLAAGAVVVGACKREGDGAGGGQGGGPRATSPAIGELLAGVPGDAAAIGFVDLSEAPWAVITRGWPVPLDDAARQNLDRELRDYLARFVGLDVSRLQYAV